MSKKVWNIIYFLALMFPVLAYFGQFITVALSDGSSPLFLTGCWDAISTAYSSVPALMPVSMFAGIVLEGSVPSVVLCWTVGLDFVLWLSIAHIILDLFMFLSKGLTKALDKFGGAD